MKREREKERESDQHWAAWSIGKAYKWNQQIVFGRFSSALNSSSIQAPNAFRIALRCLFEVLEIEADYLFDVRVFIVAFDEGIRWRQPLICLRERTNLNPTIFLIYFLPFNYKLKLYKLEL